MRMPQPAPPERLADFARTMGIEWFERAMALVSGPTVRGEYIPWDKLRRLPPPETLTHAQWWALLQLYRTSMRRSIPLRDKAGSPFGYVQTDSISRALHEIDLQVGGALQSDGVILPTQDMAERVLIRSLIEEAITSSQIEGATTTREVAKDMLRRNRAPRNAGERMILNNYRAMRRIGELRDEALTPALVFEIHRLVTQDAMDDADAGGRFRRADETIHIFNRQEEVVVYTPPPSDQLPARMEAMCAFANGETPDGFLHPALRAIALHFWLAYDHPFVDGNGRTARALFYWCMLRNKYWLFEYVSISDAILRHRGRYDLAYLHTETYDNDLTYFILYHLEMIKESIQRLHEHLAAAAKKSKAIEESLREHPALNHRQRALLGHAARHPAHTYTIAAHQRSHAIAYATARADLLDLVARGFLTQVQSGKSFHFQAAADLGKRLAPRPDR